MRILVFSPVRLFGEGISAFLLSLNRFDAVLVEHDATALEATAVEFRADLALFDVTSEKSLPVAQTLKALCPDVMTIAMAVPEVAENVIACADAGFAAYIPRNASAAEMLAIVDRALCGETVCAPRIARSLFDELSRRRATHPPPDPDDCLTLREIETARMLARGLSNKEIARELQLSVATVKNHVHSVLQKLQVRSRAQVATLLVDNPWVLRFPISRPVASRLDA
ncbi:response regulator transcription factor [Actinopolymorpha rutila]|uniref:DNA-binding NarL/FixJ family response regulator n=1 Tax=Actinopolymorpha rutila TaxID=446787 RepID=A0A852ZLF5_9ACTN|nr:response regulator transcription factor [Actinopolymorpha rutila]NYH92442.1 DNA-binding NarL/FixJ family response regulator [Actinopolymorpha rutila]